MSVPTFGKHRTPPPRTPEVFAPYERYLDSSIWPSIRDGNKQLEHVDVDGRDPIDGQHDMAPQYATGALHKLVRWARTEPAGEVATIDDIDAREEFVRMSVLGRHLQARSIGLTEEQMHALFGEAGHGEGASDADVVKFLITHLQGEYDLMSLDEIVTLSFIVYHAIDEKFLIRKRQSL